MHDSSIHRIIAGSSPALLHGFAGECLRDADAVRAFAHGSTFLDLDQFAAHRSTVVDLACKERDASHFSGDHRDRQSVEAKFGDFLDAFAAAIERRDHWLNNVEGLQLYLCQCPIAVPKPDETCEAPMLPRIMELFTVPASVSSADLTQVNLWMSIEASRTGIHYDAYRNILLVLNGKKTVKLYPPSQAKYLYPRPVYSASANHSTVNLARPDLISHPDFIHAQPTTLTAAAGDAIFIPEGWWHQVDSDPFTVAINFWFEGIRHALVRDPAMGVYYARVVMQELVKHETECALADYQAAARARISIAPSTTLAGSHNQHEFEEAVVALASDELPSALMHLAESNALSLADSLCNASDAFGAFLATAFDSLASQDATWIGSMFESLGQEADRVKRELLAKHDNFKRLMLTKVVLASLSC